MVYICFIPTTKRTYIYKQYHGNKLHFRVNLFMWRHFETSSSRLFNKLAELALAIIYIMETILIVSETNAYIHTQRIETRCFFQISIANFTLVPLTFLMKKIKARYFSEWYLRGFFSFAISKHPWNIRVLPLYFFSGQINSLLHLEQQLAFYPSHKAHQYHI